MGEWGPPVSSFGSYFPCRTLSTLDILLITFSLQQGCWALRHQEWRSGEGGMPEWGGGQGEARDPKVREVEKWNQKQLVTASRETSRHSCSQWIEWH